MENIQNIKPNKINITWASVDYIFPVETCLKPDTYGVEVRLYQPKDNFNQIELGEPHYNQLTHKFLNTSDGYMFFKRRQTKTIAKKYIYKAIDILSSSN